MSYLTQACSDLVQAQAQLHRLARLGADIERNKSTAWPGLRQCLQIAQHTQESEVKRISAILSSVGAANDMDMSMGAA